MADVTDRPNRPDEPDAPDEPAEPAESAESEPAPLTTADCVTCPACAALVPVASQATHFAWHWDMENRLRETSPIRRGGPPSRFGPTFPPGAVPPTTPLQ